MANNYTHYSFTVEGTKEQIADLVRRLDVLAEKYNSDDDDAFEIGYPATSWEQQGDTSVWFFAEESENFEGLALALSNWLEGNNLPPIGFEVAYTCSRPRVGEFGGCAVFITAEGVEFMSTNNWLASKLAACGYEDCFGGPCILMKNHTGAHTEARERPLLG